MKPTPKIYPHGPISYRMSVRYGDASATFGYESLLAPAPRMRDIAAEVAERHGLRLADLTGPSRLAPFVRARQEAMWLIRRLRALDGQPRYSLPQIGRFLGCRDHTTVLHGVRRHQGRLDAAKASQRAWSAVA